MRNDATSTFKFPVCVCVFPEYFSSLVLSSLTCFPCFIVYFSFPRLFVSLYLLLCYSVPFSFLLFYHLPSLVSLISLVSVLVFFTIFTPLCAREWMWEAGVAAVEVEAAVVEVEK